MCLFVPNPHELSDDKLLSRIRTLYAGTRLAEIEREWELLSKTAGEKGRERFRARYLRRMWNASEFMKTLKQLADGPKRPNELRAAVGIASANYFTARYLTPLAEAGYIAVEGGEKMSYA